MVGLRVGGDLTENLSLTVTGNVGGFDIGSASKFSWEVVALLGYRLGERWGGATAGYRGLGMERREGRHERQRDPPRASGWPLLRF